MCGLFPHRWRCDGKDCGGHITGARFHCLVCEDFDLCYGCQKTRNWPPRSGFNIFEVLEYPKPAKIVNLRQSKV